MVVFKGLNGSHIVVDFADNVFLTLKFKIQSFLEVLSINFIALVAICSVEISNNFPSSQYYIILYFCF